MTTDDRPAEPIDPRDVVLRFLASIGRPDEARRYLELFSAEAAGRFALLHVSHGVLRDASDALVVDLRLLAALGLRPAIALGAERTRNAVARAEQLARALGPTVPAAVIPAAQGVAAVRAALDGGVVPIVPIAEPAGEARAVEDRRFDQLAALAAALGVPRVVFVGRRSGLQPTDGRVVSLLDLATEKAQFLFPGVLPGPQAALLRQIDRLVDATPQRLTVSVTSPLDLLRELFTVKGAGTLVRRGSTVLRHDAGAGVDRDRLVALIETAFGRRLRPAAAARPAAAIYVADDYRGAAVVEDTPLAPYLSKFAVGLQARGEGVGRDLWRAMAAEHPRLFWRSRAANPVTAWYREQCDGSQRVRVAGVDWVVLWRGLQPDELAAAIAHAAACPQDFDP